MQGTVYKTLIAVIHSMLTWTISTYYFCHLCRLRDKSTFLVSSLHTFTHSGLFFASSAHVTVTLLGGFSSCQNFDETEVTVRWNQCFQSLCCLWWYKHVIQTYKLSQHVLIWPKMCQTHFLKPWLETGSNMPRPQRWKLFLHWGIRGDHTRL